MKYNFLKRKLIFGKENVKTNLYKVFLLVMFTKTKPIADCPQMCGRK